MLLSAAHGAHLAYCRPPKPRQTSRNRRSRRRSSCLRTAGIDACTFILGVFSGLGGKRKLAPSDADVGQAIARLKRRWSGVERRMTPLWNARGSEGVARDAPRWPHEYGTSAPPGNARGCGHRAFLDGRPRRRWRFSASFRPMEPVEPDRPAPQRTATMFDAALELPVQPRPPIPANQLAGA